MVRVPLAIRRLQESHKGPIGELLDAFRANQFVLVSGRAGTGKSYLLREFRSRLQSQRLRVATTAPTGVAALNVEGTTLHAWLGMGCLSDVSVEEALKRTLHPRTKNALLRTEVLLIDEISMVHPTFFEILATVVQKVHQSDSPFGHLKIVMFGDFLQLPPVHRRPTDVRFTFQTDLWKSLGVVRMRLRNVHRQKKDAVYLDLLNQIRAGVLDSAAKNLLAGRVVAPPTPFTRLCCLRRTVERFNATKLEEIDQPACTYQGTFSAEGAELRSLKREIATSDLNFPVPRQLTLKVGSQVMVRCNTHIGQGVCNGSTGLVTRLGTDEICVLFDRQKTIAFKRHAFRFATDTDTTLVLSQFPLCLAYAITIHKSQGMTLGRVLVDTSCFEAGQLYTALSRVRVLADLFLTDLDEEGLRVDEHALAFETAQS